MTHVIDCGKVNPTSGCGHDLTGKTADETLRLAAEHAQREHGLKPTPELMALVQQHMTSAQHEGHYDDHKKEDDHDYSFDRPIDV